MEPGQMDFNIAEFMRISCYAVSDKDLFYGRKNTFQYRKYPIGLAKRTDAGKISELRWCGGERKVLRERDDRAYCRELFSTKDCD